MRTSWGRLVACVVAVALVAGACGSGRSGDAGGPSTADTQTTTTDNGMFGTLDSPCGPGDASGATDLGVTDAEITIGYGDDAGFQGAPGLDHEMSDAVKAMIAWCNDQGGINGRQVVGDYHDAAITEVTNAVAEACQRDFFLVGEGWSLDSSQEPARRDCGLPAVPGFTSSTQFSNAPLMWNTWPNPADYNFVGTPAQLARAYPDEVKKAAVVYGNYAATQDSRDKTLTTFPSVGWEFIDCNQEYNITGEATWAPIVQKMKDCGVEAAYFAGAPYPNFENLLAAADQADYHPIWMTDGNGYDPVFAAWNVDGFGDNVYIRQYTVPFEEAADVPAIQQYIDIVEANGGDTSPFGAYSAAAFLLWATAAQRCGSDLTRDCVAGELSNVHEWDAGGLFPVSDPGANLISECALTLRMQGTGYVRWAPEEPGTFECDPSFVAPTSGAILERANLDANRISQL